MAENGTIKWQVNSLKGEQPLQEINIINVEIHGELEKAEALLHVKPAEKMFFNGYQTWTWCPEYSATDNIRGLRFTPKKLVSDFGLDRYGDYHFIKYSGRKGRFHGFSYCYFRNGSNYRMFASLDEYPGYTIFFYDCQKQQLRIVRDCQGVVSDGSFKAFSFAVIEGREDEVFDRWFELLNVKPITDKKLFGYSSWYNRYENISIESIEEDLRGCRGLLQPGDVFQIDDGWEPAVGDWLRPDPVKFPDGLKPICDRIHSKGYISGLWLAPFVAATKSQLYKEHQDWFLKYEGENWSDGCNWGGFCSLDLDNREVRAYIEKCFDRVFNEWGFDMVKLDFLYGGAVFGDAERSRAAKMIDAMKWLREICGNKLILGCGVPLMPAFGLVDYCRIGPDVGLDWDGTILERITHRERVSTSHAIDNTVYRRQLNGRAFLNDPDVFFLRTDNISLSEDQKEYLSKINGLFSGILLTSDNFNKYDEKQKKTLGKVRELMDAEVLSVNNNNIRYQLNGVIKGLKKI
ncbi:MAG: alpha-galactosidase [Erysipelotrichaceae bacterium]|nr:alpha-galactosidase [Erysipelotrichaceae bacterium]